MKKIISFLSLSLLASCTTNLDPSLPWRISGKSAYTGEINKINICFITITDGKNRESFDDSCVNYKVGDTVGHHNLKNNSNIHADSIVQIK